jgi:hypothetical protein
MAEKHLVKKWRGKRESYNFLKSVNRLDSWTRYSVIETDGTVVEYFGENQIYQPTGQLLPVSAIVETAPLVSEANPYDRYLVGTDANGYKIVEYQPISTTNGLALVAEELIFDEKYGVRVKAEGLKNFVYVNGTLKTYDDVDCGVF